MSLWSDAASPEWFVRISLLGDDDGVEEIRPQAAVLLGHAHREEALLAHLLPGLAGDDPRLLPLLDVGGDLLGEEPPQRIPEHPVFIGVLQNFHFDLLNWPELILRLLINLQT